MTVEELKEHLEFFDNHSKSKVYIKTDEGKFFTLKNIAIAGNDGFIIAGEEVLGDC